LRTRAPGWWSFAESLLLRLTTPSDDVFMSDRRVERVVTGSAIFRFGRSASAAIGQTWDSSWLRMTVGSIVRDLPADRRSRVRMIAVLVVVAALTAAALELVAWLVAGA
jgi:hypothetical protein